MKKATKSVNIPRALRIHKSKFLEKMKPEDILTSPEMIDYLATLAQGVEDTNEIPIIKLIVDTSGNITAFMNENVIVINVRNELVVFYDTTEKQIMCVIGMFYHEYSHRKYLDLGTLERINALRLKGEWPCSTPGFDPISVTEIKAYLADKETGEGVAMVLAKLAWDINNILADVHDENLFMRKYPGLPAKALAYPQIAMYELAPVFEDELKTVTSKSDRLSFMLSLILRFARFRDVKIYSEDHWDNEFVLKLADCIDYIDDGIEEDDAYKRQAHVNELLVICWPFIKDVIDEMKENDMLSGKDFENELDKLLEKLDNSGKDAKSLMPTGVPRKSRTKGTGSEKSDKAEDRSDEDGKKEGKGSGKKESEKESAKEKLKKVAPERPEISDDEAAKRIASKLSDEVAERAAAEEMEKARLDEMNAEISAVNARGHEGIRIIAKRKIAVTPEMKKEYEKIARPLLPISKIIQRKFMQVVKDRRSGGISYGEIFGNRLDDKSFYRVDGQHFVKMTLPTDYPKLAVAVLVDESGSMVCNKRSESARAAAILLEDFTRNLGIPTLICGHSTEGERTFTLYSYVEFDKIDRNDKYRLVDIRARMQNRDGLALKIMCERLSKRPEDKKILIVISDGQPADYNYGGKEAEKEMQEICKQYRRKGITIFAAAIGDDRENIKRIYQEGYLDISDLSKLPKLLIDLVKRYIR